MSQIGRGETEVAERWRRQIQACRRSGLSQAEFCRRHGLNQGTFSGWKTKLKPRADEPRQPALPNAYDEPLLPERRAVRPGGGSAGFVEVRRRPVEPVGVCSGPGERSGYEIVLAGLRTIRIPEHFDPQSISRLIAVVESC